MRWVGVVALVGALVVPPALPPAAGHCPGQEVPPAPAAVEETGPPVAALPWPDEPVGGTALGGCGDIGPAGVPAVGAAAFVLADLDTGVVLAARAPHARHRPASTLKVLTSIVALQRLDLDSQVEGTVDDLAIDGSKAGIGPGTRYSVRELLEGLLLNSGNDAAAALARAIGGTPQMLTATSATARELGALDTRPTSPSGLDAPGMSASAYDLALLFRAAMHDERFTSLISLRTVPFPGWGEHPPFTLSNDSRMLSHYPGTLGAKSGFTDAARHTLVGAAERDGRRLVFALVRGEQRPTPMWQQAAALLDWGFTQPRDGTGFGRLVDAPPPLPAPAPGAPPAAATLAATPPVPLAGVLLGVGGVLAMLAGALLLVRHRRRSR
ncbi:D-alanyl-D-alanine carboxypeptidase family protein [Pseudonocardia sp. TRM90224]|uniref:D-alanyl-D-alanine carboxypeptidase family protein n=1 Tax=Pseudonocardia sp. TRM90224 TaxID=2812678 RepID=UPI001E5C2367|nr:serine hydrolase [Pseudonocardia sp. TRM90224]